MESKIHGGLRVLELDVGGTFVIPVEGLGPEGKDITRPLGLTLWANKIDSDQW